MTTPPPEPFTLPVVICPSCGHGIDPHGFVDKDCGVGDAEGNLCPCMWSPNDIAGTVLWVLRAQIEAMLRWLVEDGHATPMATRQIMKILEGTPMSTNEQAVAAGAQALVAPSNLYMFTREQIAAAVLTAAAPVLREEVLMEQTLGGTLAGNVIAAVTRRNVLDDLRHEVQEMRDIERLPHFEGTRPAWNAACDGVLARLDDMLEGTGVDQ